MSEPVMVDAVDIEKPKPVVEKIVDEKPIDLTEEKPAEDKTDAQENSHPTNGETATNGTPATINGAEPEVAANGDA